MWNIILGLANVMTANILLGTSIATIRKSFDKEKFWNGIIKCVLVIISILLMYLCSYLNPDIMVANINGQEVNLISGMEAIFVAGIIFYGFQSLLKLTQLLKLKIDIKEK